MAEPTGTSGGDAAAVAPGVKRDPLRPSARRVVWLVAGATCCMVAFGIGFACGLLPILARVELRRSYLERAAAQDSTIDFASAEWLEATLWEIPGLPWAEATGYARSAILIGLVIVTMLLVAVHIVIARFAAMMALRADRRLDLGLGDKPAKSLAAAVMVRVLFSRLAPVSAACGLIAGLAYLGGVQQNRLTPMGLAWLPVTLMAAATGAVLLFDLFISMGAVRRRLQEVAPIESRVCNGCGYSLRGLPPSTESCPECGRVLLENLTVVSMVWTPRAARGLRMTAFAFVLLAAGGLATVMLFSSVASQTAWAWLSVRGNALPPWSVLASVVSPDGAVLVLSDGKSRTLITARSIGVYSNRWELRARAIEPDATGVDQRIEMRWKLGAAFTRTPMVSRPATVTGIYPSRDGVFSMWVSGRFGPLSVKFAKREDIGDADWEWLTAQLPTADAEAQVEPTLAE